MRQYELVERVRAYTPDVDEDRLNRAYVYTVQMHGAQKRASGDPYFSHPVEVAGLMTDLKMDEDTIITALLHDTVEDTLATIEDIEKNFGSEVARLVDGVTKLSKIEAMGESERAAENLRKFLLAMSEDIRVLLVKLADRLHNMRTLHFIKSEDKRRRIARETMDIYAPIANRLGLNSIFQELEDLSFKYLYPDRCRVLSKAVSAARGNRREVVTRILETAQRALAGQLHTMAGWLGLAGVTVADRGAASMREISPRYWPGWRVATSLPLTDTMALPSRMSCRPESVLPCWTKTRPGAYFILVPRLITSSRTRGGRSRNRSTLAIDSRSDTVTPWAHGRHRRPVRVILVHAATRDARCARFLHPAVMN